MEKLNKRSLNISEFDMDTYVLVYNEKDWEGGVLSEMTLKTKSEFYDVAARLSVRRHKKSPFR